MGRLCPALTTDTTMASRKDNSRKRTAAKTESENSRRGKKGPAPAASEERVSAEEQTKSVSKETNKGAEAATGSGPKKTNRGPKAAPTAAEKTLEWLKYYADKLAEKPPADRRIGPYRDSPESLDWREYFMYWLLKIRNKNGTLLNLTLNRAQQEMQRRSTNRNIVLKARQLGVTTYVAARFFISTITREGTLSVQVAHDQRSAEEIFRIVHRFLENLPENVAQGRAGDIARQRPPDRVSDDGQRIPRGNRGGPQRRPRVDHPELALFGGRPLAARCCGDTGVVTGGGAAGWGDFFGVDAERRGRRFLRGVAERAGDWLHAALLSLVVGPELSTSSVRSWSSATRS